MERILSLASSEIYDIDTKSNGENNMPCPECSQKRRKKNTKCFSYNAEKEVGYCSHCEARFVKHNPYEKKEYIKPIFKFENYTKLSDNLVKWFNKRGISQNTLLSARISEKVEYVPQIEKEANCVVFPFFKSDELINIKYRDGRKNFKLSSGAELIWYNYNGIYNAINNDLELIIVEGEIDALSLIQCGFDNVVSVPNGASGNKMEYFDSSLEDLLKVKGFILAVDNDEKGIELRKELTRRLGIENCKIANFKQYKDINEVLVGGGVESVKNAINSAKLTKIDNIYEVLDFQNELDIYFEYGLPQGKTIGIDDLDSKIRWLGSHYAVVTGSPASGKSEFIDFVVSKLNILHGWKVGYYSPETYPLPVHFAKIFSKFCGKKFKKSKYLSVTEKEIVQDYINENYFWIASPLDFTLDEILSRFEYLVKTKGCKTFVIDPFNRIEVEQDNLNNERLFIKKVLKKLDNFVKKNDVLLFLIAHPRKLEKNKTNGKFPMPSMYDISGSADFNNMTSYGIAVRREQDDESLEFLTYGQVSISKAKFNETMGDTGVWDFRYNINNGRYITDLKSENNITFDNLNWITKQDFDSDFEKEELPTIPLDLAFEVENKYKDCPF